MVFTNKNISYYTNIEVPYVKKGLHYGPHNFFKHASKLHFGDLLNDESMQIRNT